MGITLQLNNSNDRGTLKAFSDADWGSDKIERKSVSGSVVFLNSNLVSWLLRENFNKEPFGV